MSADINQEALRRSEALHRLADALSDDILNTPAEKLIAEVAEDYGDGRALAKTFNRMLTRAIRQSTWHLIGSPSIEFWARISSVVAWRPVMASIATVLVVVIAADLSVRPRHRGELQAIARAPAPAAPVRAISERPAIAHDQSEPLKREAVSEAASLSHSVNAARTPSPGEVSADNYSKSGPTVTRHPIEPERNTPAASASPPLPQIAQAIPPESAPRPTVDKPVGSAERAVSSLSNAAPASAAVPSFIWPVRGRVVAGFGRRAGSLRNDGINIAVPEGTDVQAADDGVVVYAGTDAKGYGNLVLLRHSSGFVTAYAHASALLVSLGETVHRGQVIAKSGRSGNVTEPVVHFEIRKGTLPIDPVQYLPPG
jgi:murein DD-endopeptidase MepM/ murein hydrolase activator NlpD